jgi:hypothetical protein
MIQVFVSLSLLRLLVLASSGVCGWSCVCSKFLAADADASGLALFSLRSRRTDEQWAEHLPSSPMPPPPLSLPMQHSRHQSLLQNIKYVLFVAKAALRQSIMSKEDISKIMP